MCDVNGNGSTIKPNGPIVSLRHICCSEWNKTKKQKLVNQQLLSLFVVWYEQQYTSGEVALFGHAATTSNALKWT